MHDSEVTDVDPVRPKRTKKCVFDPAPYRRLFHLFRFLRAASAEALDELFFKRAFPHQCVRNRYRRIERLVDEGYMTRLRLPGSRIVYILTRSSLAMFADAGIYAPETLRRPPTAEVGGCLWLHSNLRAEHERQGFKVERGPMAAHALRRFMLSSPVVAEQVVRAVHADDGLRPPATDGCLRCGFRASFGVRPPMCPCASGVRPILLAAKFKCRSCGAIAEAAGPHGWCDALMEEVDVVPVDVAWRKVDGRYDVRLLFVEHPARSLAAQLREIPLKHVGAMKVPVVLRSTDPDSRYDRKNHVWLAKGPRHQQLERAFSEDARDETLPFFKTARVIDVLPDLQLHIMRSGAPAPAWECAAPWNGGSKYAGRANQQQEHAVVRQQERVDERVIEREHARPIDFVALRRAAAEVARESERDARERRDEPVRVAKREPVPAIVRDDDRGGGGRRR